MENEIITPETPKIPEPTVSLLKQLIQERGPDEALPTRWVSWEDDGPDFEIQPLSDDLTKQAREASVDPDQPMRSVKRRGFRVEKVQNIKDELLGRNIVKSALVSWKRLTAGNLLGLLEPGKVKVVLNGVDPKTSIPYTGESVDLLLESSSVWFRDFIGSEAIDFSAFIKERQDDEKGNSPSTSAGS